MPSNNNKVDRIHKDADNDPRSLISSKNKEHHKIGWAMVECDVIHGK